jgi:hypothetical protein
MTATPTLVQFDVLKAPPNDSCPALTPTPLSSLPEATASTRSLRHSNNLNTRTFETPHSQWDGTLHQNWVARDLSKLPKTCGACRFRQERRAGCSCARSLVAGSARVSIAIRMNARGSGRPLAARSELG